MIIVCWHCLLGIKLNFLSKTSNFDCLFTCTVCGWVLRHAAQSAPALNICSENIEHEQANAFLKDSSQCNCGKTPADCKVSKGNLWKWLLINGAKITKICSQRPKLPPSSKYLAAVSHARWLRSAEFYVQDLEITRHEGYSPYHCITTFTQKRVVGKPCSVPKSK